MDQISRPFQIALAAVALLGLVWAIALRGHGNPSEPAPAGAPKSASSPSSTGAGAKGPAAPTPIYHGAAPGVEGLTRAIAKAHGAVATSQQNAQQLQKKSGEASGEHQTSTTAPTVAAVKPSGAATTRKSIEATALARRTAARTRSHSLSSTKSHPGRSNAQVQVESELAHGKTVMLVFWNPKSAVDREVEAQAGALAHGSKGSVTVHTALPHQVSVFGKITEVAHVYQTPTILIVNRHGVVSTLTGLTDVFALQQAVREARTAKR